MKYILLLFSVFCFGQASNQMITFTAAQSLGFALNAGQSHVTSNQCMTKNDALTKYNLSASAMSSYASNQLVPKSVWVSGYFSFVTAGLTAENGAGACTIGFDPMLDFNLYSNVSTPFLGNIMYTNSSLTTAFNGGNLWYRIGGTMDGASYQISSTGVLINAYNCGF